VALSKPQLLLPLLALLAYQRQFLVLFVAALGTGVLWIFGMHLTGATFHDYLAAVAQYSFQNAAASPSTMGLPNLLAVVAGAPSPVARQIAFAAGLVSVGLVIVLQHLRGGGSAGSTRCLPLALLLGPGFFGARTYDLVFVIPAFVWFTDLRTSQRRAVATGICLLLVLVLPQQAVQLGYSRVLSPLMPASVFALTLAPFRSWILMALIAVSAGLAFGSGYGRRRHEPA
jgi:hypothetical protein